ncbi:MAG: hypothetical protein N2V78_09135 [Methanophagales archaeon]|nr:hypothetical protein [Methanophagales archaeon]
MKIDQEEFKKLQESENIERLIMELEKISKSRGFEIRKCPKCGGDAYCDQTVIVGGLIEQKVDEDGRIHQTSGAHEKCVKWKCEKCGYEFKMK